MNNHKILSDNKRGIWLVALIALIIIIVWFIPKTYKNEIVEVKNKKETSTSQLSHTDNEIDIIKPIAVKNINLKKENVINKKEKEIEKSLNNKEIEIKEEAKKEEKKIDISIKREEDNMEFNSKIKNNTLTITEPWIYYIKWKFDFNNYNKDFQIVIDSKKQEEVYLVLNDVEIKNKEKSIINIKDWNVIIFLEYKTNNYLLTEKWNENVIFSTAKKPVVFDWNWYLFIQNWNFLNKDISKEKFNNNKSAVYVKDKLFIESWNIKIQSLNNNSILSQKAIIINWGNISIYTENWNGLDLREETKPDTPITSKLLEDKKIEINDWNLKINTKEIAISSSAKVEINNWEIDIESKKEAIKWDNININNWNITLNANESIFSVSEKKEKDIIPWLKIQESALKKEVIDTNKVVINWWNLNLFPEKSKIVSKEDIKEKEDTLDIRWGNLIIYWGLKNEKDEKDKKMWVDIQWGDILYFFYNKSEINLSKYSSQNIILIELDTITEENSYFSLKDNNKIIIDWFSPSPFKYILISSKNLKNNISYDYEINNKYIWSISVLKNDSIWKQE